MAESYPFLKGHGTENDFVLLPDHDGTVHGPLDPVRVRALCDRRAGIGGDGVLRVIRTEAWAEATGEPVGESAGTEWFMDYRNADGSISEMCGNGVRVFARHLVAEGLVDPARPIRVGTRDGVKTLQVDGELITADMGTPRLLGSTSVAVGERRWTATGVDMGNPHAVAFVESLDPRTDVGPLLEEPGYDAAFYPEGVNVEFVVRRGDRHLQMRVHERGSGETRSCGTGACAVMVAAAVADGARLADGAESTYRIDLPGGTLSVTWTAEDRILMTGPALVVASGHTSL